MHLIALSVLFIGFCAEGADYLIWHPKARTFDFRIRDLPLEKFLGIVKAETGWEVKVEPGLTQLVGGKFRDKPAADAIRLMLGRTRFALLPRVEGGTRLTVYSGSVRDATEDVKAVAQKIDVVDDTATNENALITLPVKIHYLKSRYVAINADPKATNLRPLLAGTNEIWQTANLRFAAGRPEIMQVADMNLPGDEQTGVRILQKAMQAPIRLIAENSGHEGSVVLNTVLAGKDDWGFDADKEEFGNLIERGIMDPAKVTRAAVENGASVATMILTTESLVSDIPEKGPATPPMPPMEY